MPLLEFGCSDCGATTEELVLAGDREKTPKCGSCGSRRVARLLSTFAARASSGGGARAGFDPAAACGGGACRMPDVCGAPDGDFDA